MTSRSRRILLLQGPPTRFFAVLQRAFQEAGVPATRIALHAGDEWRAAKPVIPYRGTLAGFGEALRAIIAEHDITDILYFADRLPYHRAAAKVADEMGVTPYAIEHGYLRPSWLTLEPGGMGAYSRFPTERAAIERIAADAPPLPDADPPYGHRFVTEAYFDVTGTLAQIAGLPFYRRYDRDRDNHPIKEYLSWLPQLIRKTRAERRAPEQLKSILAHDKPFFLFPMQLQEDYQIRHNSRFARLADLVDEVFASFAAHAPAEASLLVKIHPLDNGLQNWRRVLKDLKRHHGLIGRIRLVHAGPLAVMLDHTEGVVLVNSTVGLTAIRAGRPVKALGSAVYDMEGLTHQGPLDGFWQSPTAPDAAFVDTYVRALAHAIQLPGSFYDPHGMAAASATIVARVTAGVGERDWFVTPPPRLAAALASGVPQTDP